MATKIDYMNNKDQGIFFWSCNALHDFKEFPKTIFASWHFWGADGRQKLFGETGTNKRTRSWRAAVVWGSASSWQQRLKAPDGREHSDRKQLQIYHDKPFQIARSSPYPTLASLMPLE